MTSERYLAAQVKSDLRAKMVFVGGPRQVGKTTLAKKLLSDSRGYLNWDIDEHRERILRKTLPPTSLWVFDEFHKFRGWRNYLKGLFDLHGPKQRILVTGSARLDFYRFGGDSLQGRYHYLRLHPFSAAELKLKSADDFRRLIKLGGFPEPYLSGSEKEAKRWSREYRSRLIREDVTSIEGIEDLGRLELLMIRLPELVASPLSLNALREDLQISYRQVCYWMDCLERMYAIFRLSPFRLSRVRAVKKERKHYHFDWSLVADNGPRFENLTACHLLKWVHFLQDSEGRDVELRYFRDVLGREVDFVVVEERNPILMVECKWSDSEPDRVLKFLKSRFPRCPAWQISATGKQDYMSADGIRVAPALPFLTTLV